MATVLELLRLNADSYMFGFGNTVVPDKPLCYYTVSINGGVPRSTTIPSNIWQTINPGQTGGYITLPCSPSQTIEVVVYIVAVGSPALIPSPPINFTTLPTNPLIVFDGYNSSNDANFTIYWSTPGYTVASVSVPGYATELIPGGANSLSFSYTLGTAGGTFQFILASTLLNGVPNFNANSITIPPLVVPSPYAPVYLATPDPLPQGILTCVGGVALQTTFLFNVSPYINPKSVITATLQGGTASLAEQTNSWIVSATPLNGIIKIILAAPIAVGNIDVSYHCSALNGTVTQNSAILINVVAPTSVSWGYRYVAYDGTVYGTQLLVELDSVSPAWTTAYEVLFNIYEDGVLSGTEINPVGDGTPGASGAQLVFKLDYAPVRKGVLITVTATLRDIISGNRSNTTAPTPPFRLVSALELYTLVNESSLFQFSSYDSPAINGAPPVSTSNYLVSFAVSGVTVVVTTLNPYLLPISTLLEGYFWQTQLTITFSGANGHTFSVPASLTTASNVPFEAFQTPTVQTTVVPFSSFQLGQNYACQVRVDNPVSLGTAVSPLQLSNVITTFIPLAPPPQPLTFTGTPSAPTSQPSIQFDWTLDAMVPPVVGTYTIRWWVDNPLDPDSRLNGGTVNVLASGGVLSTFTNLVIPGLSYTASIVYTTTMGSSVEFLSAVISMPLLTNDLSITSVQNVGLQPPYVLNWFANVQLINPMVNGATGLTFTLYDAGSMIITTSTILPPDPGTTDPWNIYAVIPPQTTPGTYSIIGVCNVNSVTSPTFYVTVEAAPAPPTEFRVTPTSTSRILNWIPPAVAPKTYEVYFNEVEYFNTGNISRQSYHVVDGSLSTTTIPGGGRGGVEYIAQIASANDVIESPYVDAFFTAVSAPFFIYGYSNGTITNYGSIFMSTNPAWESAPSGFRPTLTNVTIRYVSTIDGSVFTINPPDNLVPAFNNPSHWRILIQPGNRPVEGTYNITVTGSISGGNPVSTTPFLQQIDYPPP